MKLFSPYCARMDYRIPLFCLALGIFAVPQSRGEEAPQFHIFTNKQGLKIEAIVSSVSMETGSITIRRRDGKTYNVAGNMFTLDDQQYLKDWLKRQLRGNGGSMKWFGKLADGRSMDASLAEGIDDIIQLHAMKDGWIAKRKTDEFLFFAERRRGLSNLAHFNANTVWSIATKKDGTLWTSPTRQQMPDSLTGIVDAVAGSNHFAAILKDGTVKIWGKRYGDDNSRVYDPPEQLSDIIQLATSQHGVAALNQEGKIYCWISGENEMKSATLGDGAVAIEGSIFDFLALSKSGEVYQWSGNRLEQAKIPNPVSENGPYQKIRCNGSTRAAQKMDGSWIAWGKNGGGIVDHINQLGPALDIAFFTEPNKENFGYVVWIEP